ncbi:uncharacterized protein LOC131679936 [Topomyia yanbarensis]|uniref:uncharacterized protein LOC131679936 n=1 Tax=Topomyia yanbarensis TaxID=2498891 RepID=UPI00273CB7D1|nr:uncharacterized protein LOC131679936 [Topomyia yanbarensis]
MASSPSKQEKCLYCKLAESDDIDWVQCEECQYWAHFSCAGVNQEVANVSWRCPRCSPQSARRLKVPETTAKNRGKKSAPNSDAGSDRGAGSVLDLTEQQLEEEQLAMEMAFAKQIELRKQRLAKQQAWNERRMKLEWEMREQELRAQREMEQRQLEHEQKMLDCQLAAEREFSKKRDAIRKQFDDSINKVNALKGQYGAVSGASASKPEQKVDDWMLDYRGAYPKPGYLQTEDKLACPKKVPLDKSFTIEAGQFERSNEDNLPKFKGEAEVWPLFISSFEYTTAACGFSNLENLKRLQDCLQGDALEAVRSRLVLPDSVPDVIRDLRNLFGKPEKLLRTLLSKVRNAPSPRADRLETFISFGITVKQLCDHLEASGLCDHLNNPMLVQELVDKLPPSYKLDWVRYKRGKVDSPLRMFTNFTNDIVSDVSEVTEFSTLSLGEREPSRMGKGNSRKKEFVHLHDADQVSDEIQRETVTKPCWICKRTDHLIRCCEEFKRMNIAARLREVERQNLCGLCLNKHGNSRCTSKIRCFMQNCRGGHHPLLHRVEESVRLQKVECNATEKADSAVIFRMMPVTLYVGKRQFDTTAFFDEGSSATLVDDLVARRLKAEGTLEPLIVTWTGNINRFENDSRKVELMMSAKGSKEKFPLFNTRTVSELVLPKQNVRFADVVKKSCRRSDNVHLFAPLESRVGKPNEPIAVRSKIGWTVYGSENRRPSAYTYLNLHSIVPASNQGLHDMMREQYMLDETAIATFAVPEPVEEKRAREMLETTTKRVGDRFETGLLWREDAQRFPDSYPMAVRRMKALDRKLNRNSDLKKNVCQQIEDYQVKHYAHKASEAELKGTPQTAVFGLVWDAAASVNGVSLNSELLKGPDMLVPLPRVICNFRERPVAFGGDIQEMYHQIRIRPEDRQAQRFLFRANSEEAPQVYVMDVATFGSTCSPCSAQFVKNLNAADFSEKYPEAVEAIVKRHYVDDYYDSVDTIEEASQFLEQIGERSVDSAVHFNWDKNTEYERVLGVVWDPVGDEFRFATEWKAEYNKVFLEEKRPTKRIVLSIVMAQFDPAGFLAPVTILGKMLVQDLWRTGCDWDDAIDELSFRKWLRWTNILADVPVFKLPRSYFGTARSDEVEEVQLHIFADASETAYGCVAYFRAIVRGKVVCSLVMSRAKVAPLKQLSIPRLELLAAVLAARLARTIEQNHNFTISRVVFWIDAEVVLSWIRSDQRRYKQFVGFRIGEILSLTKLTDWRWVPTRLNVADLVTKWGKGLEIHPNSPWATIFVRQCGKVAEERITSS